MTTTAPTLRSAAAAVAWVLGIGALLFVLLPVGFFLCAAVGLESFVLTPEAWIAGSLFPFIYTLSSSMGPGVSRHAAFPHPFLLTLVQWLCMGLMSVALTWARSSIKPWVSALLIVVLVSSANALVLIAVGAELAHFAT